MRLLDCCGLPLATWRMVRSEDDAVRAAAEVGGRVALKADVPGVVHKSDAGAVVLSLAGERQVRRAYRTVDVTGLQDTLLRLSRLAEDHADVAELDLNPIIARPDGVVAVDARVRVVPQRHWDPYLRRLR